MIVYVLQVSESGKYISVHKLFYTNIRNEKVSSLLCSESDLRELSTKILIFSNFMWYTSDSIGSSTIKMYLMLVIFG